MRILGLDIKAAAPRLRSGGTRFEERTRLATQKAEAPHLDIRAKAPPLPPRGMADNSIIEILPPFGEPNPGYPIAPGNTNLAARNIYNDPRELWYLSLPSKLTPNQILQILRSALGGDLWQQWQLLSLMLDSWPMLRKCVHELCEAVAYTVFKVKPYIEEDGEDASDEAKERADVVKRAMTSWRPNQFTDEKGWTGFIYNFCEAMINGLVMQELMWYRNPYQGQPEIMPRAAAWVHPRHYTFSNDGIIAIFNEFYSRMYWPLADDMNRSSPPPDKFLCAQFMSKSGSALGAGLMRPLAWYWSAVVFNREWMLNTAMKFGSPFIDVAVKNGMQPKELALIDAEIAQWQNQHWGRHPEAATIQIHPAQSLGQENPQRHLMEEADKACMFLLLGQEGTTKSTPGKLGGEDQKSKVKRERVEGLAKWIGSEPLQQFARAVIRLNYGDEDMVPAIEPDFTETTDPMAQAQVDGIMLQNKVPMLFDDFCKRHKYQTPEEGDLVIIGGQVGRMGSIDEEVKASTPPPEPPAMGPDGKPVALSGQPKPQPEPQKAVQAMLRHTSTEDLQELGELIAIAHKAPHRNGEIKAVKTKLKALKRK